MVHVVSVSLGSTKRDVDKTVEILGHDVRLERRGTNGSVEGARRLVSELDGQVDAIGLGGLDLFVTWRGRRYFFREARRIASAATRTPVVCGAGLKDTLERRAVALLDASLGWRGRRVLVSSASDRGGMTEALVEHGATVGYGDLAFVLGVPWLVRSARVQDALVRVLAPIAAQLPISWLYATGSKQDRQGETTERYARFYAWADVIAGDWHFIRRYAPADLAGKIVFTNTTTQGDVDFLTQRGVTKLITTTPRYGDRSIATNLLEAAFVGIRGRRLARADYEGLLDELGYRPTELDLRLAGAAV
jgi:hypothetical protein